MDKEVLHKEIDLIQDCIKRMAHNSFLIKGWTISIIVVVLALVEKQIDSIYLCLILLIPILSFWYLDAFFLRTERMYRKMYKWVINNRENNNCKLSYDLNPGRFAKEVSSQLGVMFSKTLIAFYFIPLLLNISIIIYLFTK